ncbi:hypothetical protein PACILC2_49020 [Paenibacillus cisolokensis]|uniref:Uncharacterized protein n=1 Tax=Paenibacillus cisolokensis TaxID=1658519 RepID=A0ABQ4NEF9_9BACL|nr:hypothetical protein PACILC2_49020 [Paenibacillus cisolokensis]
MQLIRIINCELCLEAAPKAAMLYTAGSNQIKMARMDAQFPGFHFWNARKAVISTMIVQITIMASRIGLS